MYIGNMNDFVNKVNDYLRKKYDCKIIFGNTKIYGTIKNYVAFFAPGQMGATGYTVFDREDFEQQIYDYVNYELNKIKDV